MMFDYLELLTIRQALGFTQSQSDILNLDYLIKKITEEMEKIKDENKDSIAG